MRLFVALDPPEALRVELDRRGRAVRRDLPAARWVRPEGMHLTLVFLGEVAAATVPALVAALEPVFAARRALELRLRGTGSFPPRGGARILWVGVEAVAGDLLALQSEVATTALAVTGSEPDRRTYHPHLTVARCRPPWPRADRDRWASAVERRARPADAPLEAAVDLATPWTVAAGTLYSSELRPDGARYRALTALPLAEPEAASDEDRGMGERR